MRTSTTVKSDLSSRRNHRESSSVTTVVNAVMEDGNFILVIFALQELEGLPDQIHYDPGREKLKVFTKL